MKISQNHPIYKKASKRESLFWKGQESYFASMQSEPKELLEYEQEKRHGDKNISDMDYLKTLGTFKKGLAIGPGGGSFEFSLMSSGIVNSFHFIDLSPKVIDGLKERAKKEGKSDKITADIQDFNFLNLEENSYDIIVFRSVLHHLINLEEIFLSINKALKPNGIIVIDDYTGPFKMQTSEAKQYLIKAFRSLLKEKGIETKDFIVTNKKILTNNCPFECIRSHELYSIIQHYFGDSVIKEVRYGGFFDIGTQVMTEYSPLYFKYLRIFDDFVSINNIHTPTNIFGVYRKNPNAKLLQTTLWTEKEIKENIGVSILNESFLIELSRKLLKNERLYSLAKKIYFFFR